MRSSQGKTRHISIRVPGELFDALEALAATNDETVSHAARRLLSDGTGPRGNSSGGLDDAIAILQRLRRSAATGPTQREPFSPLGELATPPTEDRPATPAPESPARTVNVLNAKANLSRLLADVARGEEIVIAHAGTRARLVPADD